MSSSRLQAEPQHEPFSLGAPLRRPVVLVLAALASSQRRGTEQMRTLSMLRALVARPFEREPCGNALSPLRFWL